MESGLECSVSKSPSLKSLFLPSSGPIQPGDLGLTGGCQATHLSAGTQGSLSLDNNSQELRDPGQGARDELSVTHRAVDGLLECCWDTTKLGTDPPRHGTSLYAWLSTHMKNRLVRLCACASESMNVCVCVEGVGLCVTVYNGDAFV